MHSAVHINYSIYYKYGTVYTKYITILILYILYCTCSLDCMNVIKQTQSHSNNVTYFHTKLQFYAHQVRQKASQQNYILTIINYYTYNNLTLSRSFFAVLSAGAGSDVELASKHNSVATCILATLSPH